MPPIAIVGASTRVVDTPGFTIDELIGNVASKDDANRDRISVAHVHAKAGQKEPWLTLLYDEWMCILKGKVVCEYTTGVANGGAEGAAEKSRKAMATLEAVAGQTLFIEKGTRFCPSFPVDTEYVPICWPAFKPERCLREDEGEEQASIAAGLQTLHGGGGRCVPDASAAAAAAAKEAKPEQLYHMCPVGDWEAAKKGGSAYYPRTYEVDGFYTHATGVPSRLITTANHFYQDVEGPWVCLEFTRTALKKCGIHTKDEEAMPVGDKDVGENWGNWICPHVIGGIPLSVVTKERPMKRDSKKFLLIEGLTS